MKVARLFVLLCASDLLAQAPAAKSARQVTVTKFDGGSAVTVLSGDIAVNKGSTLHRRWFVLNDPTCPIALDNMGLTSKYNGDGYDFHASSVMTAKEPIVAYELVFAAFDVWGERMGNFETTRLPISPPGRSASIDMPNGERTKMMSVNSSLAWPSSTRS